MSRRIAHRPRYRHMHHLTRFSHSTRQEFFARHWTYRRQKWLYPPPIPGQSLLLLPFQRFVHSLKV